MKVSLDLLTFILVCLGLLLVMVGNVGMYWEIGRYFYIAAGLSFLAAAFTGAIVLVREAQGDWKRRYEL